MQCKWMGPQVDINVSQTHETPTNCVPLCITTHVCGTVLPMNGTVAKAAHPRPATSTMVLTHYGHNTTQSSDVRGEYVSTAWTLFI